MWWKTRPSAIVIFLYIPVGIFETFFFLSFVLFLRYVSLRIKGSAGKCPSHVIFMVVHDSPPWPLNRFPSSCRDDKASCCCGVGQKFLFEALCVASSGAVKMLLIWLMDHIACFVYGRRPIFLVEEKKNTKQKRRCPQLMWIAGAIYKHSSSFPAWPNINSCVHKVPSIHISLLLYAFRPYKKGKKKIVKKRFSCSYYSAAPRVTGLPFCSGPFHAQVTATNKVPCQLMRVILFFLLLLLWRAKYTDPAKRFPDRHPFSPISEKAWAIKDQVNWIDLMGAPFPII